MPGIVTIPFIDAQKGNVYSGIYAWQESKIVELSPVQVYTLDEALELCGQQDTTVMAVGDMVQKKLANRQDFRGRGFVGKASGSPKGSSWKQ